MNLWKGFIKGFEPETEKVREKPRKWTIFGKQGWKIHGNDVDEFDKDNHTTRRATHEHQTNTNSLLRTKNKNIGFLG